MKDKAVLTLVAIPTLGAMAIVNLLVGGPDGAIFVAVAGMIAGLGGYVVGRRT